MKGRREDVRYRTNHMEKKNKLKAMANLAAAAFIVGMALLCGAKNLVTAIIAGAMVIAGGTASILFEDILDELEREMADLKEEPKESGTFTSIYQPEYTFVEFLLENHISFPEFLAYIDGVPEGPKEAFRQAYEEYKKSAGGRKIQSVDLVQSFLLRERRRRDVG